MNTTKKGLVLVLVLLLTLATASVAFAGGGYCSQPGCDESGSHTECYNHGSFGYFGEQGSVHDLGINNLGSNGEPGANGQLTGYNNSHLCGNPQNQP